MTLTKRTIIPIAIFGGLLLVAAVIKMNPPETRQRSNVAGPQLAVEALTLAPRDYSIMLESYGTVQPRTRSMLVAQVSGQIVAVNPNVRDGGFFERGDVLVTIDERDYAANVRIAEAALADAQQALAEAEARTEQAREDWLRLGNSGTAPDLVLRVPQLEAAKARVRSARATLEKSQLDLERTRIKAPFAGRVLRKFVDLGQVVGTNSQVAEIYATDVVEIRLPLRNRDLPYISLPEAYRDSETVHNSGAAVKIQSELAGNATWDAELVRTEGAIDETARQLHVIAKIDDPFSDVASTSTPLKIGQYVTAKLQGNTISNALVIPNQTIYQGSYVYVAEDGILRRRDIDIAWQNDEEAIIAAGLEAGDKLVTTSLGQVTSGIRVSIIGENNNDQRQGPGRRGAPGTAAPTAPAQPAGGDSQ
jgi:RND family efflux transporter MFP subunit